MGAILRMRLYNGGKLVFHFPRHYIAPGSVSSHYQHQNIACPKAELFSKAIHAFMLWFKLQNSSKIMEMGIIKVSSYDILFLILVMLSAGLLSAVRSYDGYVYQNQSALTLLSFKNVTGVY